MNELTNEERQWLFGELWTPAHALVNEFCVTCGEVEGYCNPEVCMRLIVTNKLKLSEATFATSEVSS